MRILALSDQHGFLPEVPDCDLLLIGGDICPDFLNGRPVRGRPDNGEQRQRNWLDTKCRAWLEGLAERGIHVVAIAGNHDFVFERGYLVPDDLPWVYLRDSSHWFEKDGERISIYGTPWCPALPSWAFYATDNMLREAANSIPVGTDIILSHSPPRGYLDRTVPMFGDMNVGWIQLTDAINRVQPKFVICGHIHEQGGGVDVIGDSTIYNVAMVDEHYKPRGFPVTEIR